MREHLIYIHITCPLVWLGCLLPSIRRFHSTLIFFHICGATQNLNFLSFTKLTRMTYVVKEWNRFIFRRLLSCRCLKIEKLYTEEDVRQTLFGWVRGGTRVTELSNKISVQVLIFTIYCDKLLHQLPFLSEAVCWDNYCMNLVNVTHCTKLILFIFIWQVSILVWRRAYI